MATEDKQSRHGSWGYLGKIVGLNLVIMAAVAVLLVIGVSIWLDKYTRHDDRIEVPNLQGVLQDDAMRYLEQAGLKAMVIDSVYANVRPGAVVEQMPTAGLPVKEGRIVYLTVNAVGKRMVKMQEVREGGSRQALSTLRTLGFVVDSIRQVASEMDDLVLSVTVGGDEMEPGREYPVGTRVVVHVGCADMEIEPENEETEDSFFE